MAMKAIPREQEPKVRDCEIREEILNSLNFPLDVSGSGCVGSESLKLKFIFSNDRLTIQFDIIKFMSQTMLPLVPLSQGDRG